MPRGTKAAPAGAARDQEIVYSFVHARRDEFCYRCRKAAIHQYDLHARSANGKRRICCECWDSKKK